MRAIRFLSVIGNTGLDLKARTEIREADKSLKAASLESIDVSGYLSNSAETTHQPGRRAAGFHPNSGANVSPTCSSRANDSAADYPNPTIIGPNCLNP